MRVVGGSLRGRPLRAPRGSATRPTADRVREALFGLLGDVSGLCVADLYAGSGALGIEALSRGAAQVTFVDSAPAAIACIRYNLERLELNARASVIHSRVEQVSGVLSRLGPYDLLLCDPPWSRARAAAGALTRLLSRKLLSTAGRVVVEHPARDPFDLPPSLGLKLVLRRGWGDTGVSLFGRADETEPAAC